MNKEKKKLGIESVMSISLREYLSATNQLGRYPVTQEFIVTGLNVQGVLHEKDYEKSIKERLVELAPEGTEVILNYCFQISPLFDGKGGIFFVADGNAIAPR